MKLAVFGPDQELARQFEGLPAQIDSYRRIDEAESALWPDIDVVVLDLQLFRVDTGGPDFDVRAAQDLLVTAAKRNPDAFWLLIAPPALIDTAFHFAKELVNVLRQGINATEIASEPSRIPATLPALQDWLNEIDRIANIPIAIHDVRPLSPSEQRCINRLLSDCQSADLTGLGDGQGDAIVMRADCVMDGGHAPPRVLKVGPAEAIVREHNNYLDFARNRLGQAQRPHHDSTDVWVAGGSGALVYSFAAGPQPRTLAAVMADGDGCPALSDLWERVLPPWLEMQEPANEPIAAFIQAFLGKVSLDEAQALWEEPPGAADGVWNPIPWLREIAGRIIDVPLPFVIAHGDLHAYNVLVDDANRAWLIDYYHTGRKQALFDAAYSDVYLMLHRVGDKLAPVACDDAALLDGETRYYAGAQPVRPELQTVRSAAMDRWGNDSAALFHLARASVALRLLRFDSTDKALAKTVASMAAAAARNLQPDWEGAPEVAPIDL
jgi:hypothetical protein